MGLVTESSSQPWANDVFRPEVTLLRSTTPTQSSISSLTKKMQLPGRKQSEGLRTPVSRAVARSLLKTSVPGMFAGLFEIVEQNPQSLLIRKTGPLVCNQPTGMYVSEAEFHFEPETNESVLVSYRIGFDRLLTGLRRIAIGLILGVGLPVLVLVGGLIWFQVVQHDNPNVRWQVFQTLQIGHVLWPPFLVMSFYRSGKTHARTYIANVLSTVDLIDD